MYIRIDIGEEFCMWEGTFSFTDTTILINLTEFSESASIISFDNSIVRGVMEYGIDDFVEINNPDAERRGIKPSARINYTLKNDVLIIIDSLSVILPFDAVRGYTSTAYTPTTPQMRFTIMSAERHSAGTSPLHRVIRVQNSPENYT